MSSTNAQPTDAREVGLTTLDIAGMPARPEQVMPDVAKGDDTASRTSISQHTESKSADGHDAEHASAAASEKAVSEKQASVPAAAAADDDDLQAVEELSRARFLPVLCGLLLGIFIVSLDNTVVATAQVPIANALGGASLIPWLPTTFLIGQAAFSLFWGQVLTVFPSKYIYMGNVFLFEIGSLISAVAPTMGCVLAGRTISGVAASGIFTGAIQILAESTSVEARAMYMGFIGMLFTATMIAGPVIGGALTKISWRWVFWINLPIGFTALVPALFLLRARPALGMSKTHPPSVLSRLSKLDFIGTVLLTGATCMLIIPIQEARNNGWSSGATWAPICLSLVIVIIFGFWVHYAGESRALLPLRLFKDKNFVGCSLVSFAIFFNIIVFMYGVPLWYETVRGHSATKSGVDMLPTMITISLSSLCTGILTRKFGVYYPQLQFFPLIGMVGAGLLYKTSLTSGVGLQIGAQFLLGLGIGPVIQAPILVVQANTADRRLIAKATAMAIFCQRLGGGVGSSISGALIAAQLPGQIRKHLPIGVDPAPYLQIPETEFFGLPDGPIRDSMLKALTQVINYTYLIGIPMFFITATAVLFLIPIRNITTKKIIKKADIARKAVCLPARSKQESAA